MAQSRLDFHFPPQLRDAAGLFQLLLEENFQRDLPPRCFFAGQIDASKLPLAQRPPHLKVGEAPPLRLSRRLMVALRPYFP